MRTNLIVNARSLVLAAALLVGAGVSSQIASAQILTDPNAPCPIGDNTGAPPNDGRAANGAPCLAAHGVVAHILFERPKSSCQTATDGQLVCQALPGVDLVPYVPPPVGSGVDYLLCQVNYAADYGNPPGQVVCFSHLVGDHPDD